MAPPIKYSLQLITAPTSEPVTTAEVKTHAVVEHSSDDTLISSLIVAARRYVEQKCNIALMRQKWRLYLDTWPDGGEITLPKWWAQEIAQIKYRDINGVEQTVTSTDYELDTGTNRVLLVYGASWPTHRYQHNATYIDFWAGYYNPTSSPLYSSTLPGDLKVAILMLATSLYNNRSAKGDAQLYVNDTLDILMAPYWIPSP